jgi:hypothetical protein
LGTKIEVFNDESGYIIVQELPYEYSGYIYLKVPGYTLSGTYNPETKSYTWDNSPPDSVWATVAGSGMEFASSEDGSEIVATGNFTVNLTGPSPVDFAITYDYQGNPLSMRVGAGASFRGFASATGGKIRVSK